MKDRVVFLDYIRVFACFLVMLVHASENFYPGPESTDMAGPQAMLANQVDRVCVSVYDGFSRMSVPLFIIVSAFLLVPMKKEQTTWEFYKKRFGKILPPFLVFTVLYCTLPLLWGQCFWNEYHLLWYFSGYLGYLVLAHYIRVHLDWNTSKRMIAGSILMVLGAVATILSYYVQAIPGQVLETPVLEIGWSFCTINVVCLTAGTFLMFSCIKQVTAPKIITELSKLSYGMYLMHIFWLHMWAVAAIRMWQLPTPVAIPFIAVSTFVCSAITTKLLSYLPGSRWIVGASSRADK